MRNLNEIEKMFHQEVREKRKIGSNIYSRTGTRGYTGTIRSAHDLLKGKARREYEGNGKVVTTNIYDTILSKEEFDKLETFEQRNRFSYWYLTYGTMKIRADMNIGAQTVYNYLDKLGIPRKGREGRMKRGTGAKAQQKAKLKEVAQTKQVELPFEAPKVDAPVVVTQTPEIDGMHLKYKGIYTAEQIQKILSKLDVLMSDEPGEFDIIIEVRERNDRN